MNNFLVIVLTTGGAAVLTAVFAGIRSMASSRQESETNLFQRLNDDADKARKEADAQRARAERAEKYNDDLRKDKEQEQDKAAKYRRLLIEHGITVTVEEIRND